jgi:hypothetical protein
MNGLIGLWQARIPALFGQCKRCTRSSMVAALSAWAVALLALVMLRRPWIALGAALIAAGLTLLWLAHLAALAARGTLASMLREFGAEPREVKAIIDALGLDVDARSKAGGRLREGEAISVRRTQRPDRPGFRLTRIVISSDQGVIAAVGLAERGSYRRLDPKDLAAAE